MRLPLLVLHIMAGVLAMFAGAAAVFFRKGSRWHGLAGNVFVVSMLLMGVCAVPLALMKHQTNNVFGGILTVYMVSTAWLTARRTDNDSRNHSVFDWAGFLFALGIGSLTLVSGWQKATGRAADDGVPTFMSFFMGSIVLLAAAGDLRTLLGGISGRRRIVRHLWRMCFAWFIAAGSFFLGPDNRPLRLLSRIGLRQQIFRALLRQEVLFFLAILPLLFLIFWFIRIRFSNAYRKVAALASRSEPALSVRSG
jgi:uncharacterized membrane protein